MVAGSNWNRDAVTSIVLTSPPPLTCRAHTAADVAPMTSRITITCLFKHTSFDRARRKDTDRLLAVHAHPNWVRPRDIPRHILIGSDTRRIGFSAKRQPPSLVRIRPPPSC